MTELTDGAEIKLPTSRAANLSRTSCGVPLNRHGLTGPCLKMDLNSHVSLILNLGNKYKKDCGQATSRLLPTWCQCCTRAKRPVLFFLQSKHPEHTKHIISRPDPVFELDTLFSKRPESTLQPLLTLLPLETGRVSFCPHRNPRGTLL